MGVALPPRSVPSESAQASTPMSMPSAAAMARMTGIMVAAKGILSTNALVTAETHRMMTTMTAALPPLTFVIKFAMTLRTPVFSRPATETNRPVKKSSVL